MNLRDKCYKEMCGPKETGKWVLVNGWIINKIIYNHVFITIIISK